MIRIQLTVQPDGWNDARKKMQESEQMLEGHGESTSAAYLVLIRAVFMQISV